MIVIRESRDVTKISNLAIRELAFQRICEIGKADFESGVLGYLLVVEPGDCVALVSEQIGFDILTNRFTGIRFNQEDFAPSFEFIQEFPSCYDMVFVLSDDGYGVEVLLPKEGGIDADLTAVCQRYAIQVAQS